MEKWLGLCQRALVELNRRKEDLKVRGEEREAMKKKITDIEAHLAQSELLKFVLSQRYIFTPLNFANAAAGLPHMSWRNSFKLCLRGTCLPGTSINYLIFEAVKVALERAGPISADEAVNEIRRRISKGKQFEGVREYLGDHWPALEDAVLTGWSSAVHANARAYKITALFLGALKKS